VLLTVVECREAGGWFQALGKEIGAGARLFRNRLGKCGDGIAAAGVLNGMFLWHAFQLKVEGERAGAPAGEGAPILDHVSRVGFCIGTSQ
jgi:hypothetical protein